MAEYKEMKDNKDWVAYLKNCFSSYSDARFRFERNWYIADNFFDGNHFVWFKKETGTIDKISAPKGTVLRAIPKASKQVEVVQNIIISNQYKWVAYPDPDEMGDVTDEAAEYSRRRSQWLQYQFDEMNMDKSVADLVLYALKFPVSFWEFYPTDDARGIGCTTYDAFDIYFKPDVEDIYDSPVLIKAVERNWDEVKANPDYTIPDDYTPKSVQPYASELKSLRFNEKYGHVQGDMGKKNTVIVKEAWVKEWYIDTEKTEEETGMMDETGQPVIVVTEKKIRKKKIRLITYLDDLAEPIRDVDTPYEDYPFVAYSTKSGALYQPSLLERLMSANKSIDLIVSGIEQFMHTMNKGRWLKHRNASLSKIYNETGQILEWDVEKPELVDQQSIPNYFFNHIANLEKWIEEQSASPASMGRVPQGARAYKTIETLKSSDAANQSVAIVNLETALEKAAEICLEIADKYFDTPQNVYRMDKEQPDYFSVVGERYYDPENMQGTVPLSQRTKVNVQVESGLSYTEEGKRQTLIELYTMGLLPKETVLEGFKFANVGELLAKTENESVKSLIDTPDFQALDPETQKAVLQELMSKNISLPQTPQDLEDRNNPAMRKRLR